MSYKSAAVVEGWFSEQKDAGRNVFSVLDPTADKDILRTVYSFEQDPDGIPLFIGTPVQHLQSMGPILVPLGRGPGLELALHLAESGRMEKCGFFGASRLSYKEVAANLSEQLYINYGNGEKALFRFYDPKILFTTVHEAAPHFYDAVTQGIDSLCFYAFAHNNAYSWILCDGNPDGECVPIKARPEDIDCFMDYEGGYLLRKHIVDLRKAMGEAGAEHDDAAAPFRGNARVFPVEPGYQIGDAELNEVASEIMHIESKLPGVGLGVVYGIHRNMTLNPAKALEMEMVLDNAALSLEKRISICLSQ